MKRLATYFQGKPVRIATAGMFVAVAALAVSFNDTASNAVVQAMSDPLSVLGQRSPGARQAGLLTKTKPAMAGLPGRGVRVASVPAPTQRVLSGVRTPGPTVIPGLGAPAPLVPAPLGGDVGPAGSPGTFGPGGLGSSPGPGGAFFPGPGGGGPGGGGGGGIVAPPTEVVPPEPPVPPVEPPVPPVVPPEPPIPPVVPPVPPVSPIPEPATWLTMIVGFGAIGLTLRRRRPRLLAKREC